MKARQQTLLLIAALLAIAFAACGAGKKASTPTEAFKLFYEATKSKDVAALKNLISKNTLAALETEAKKQNKSLGDYLAEGIQSAPATMPQVGEEKIDGDRATVKFKTENANNWSTFSFVKEDGGWKIQLR
jgi:uncharacterized lipoprotein